MKNLTWQNPEQLFVAQVLINKVKSKCCGIKGLLFSKYSILYDVVDREFPLEVAVEDQEAFVKNLLPLVDNVYSIYDLTDDDFAQSPDYDQLYTELTGAVAIFIESNGVQ